MSLAPGDVVRTGEKATGGHTRLPAYLAGKRGIIVAHLGDFVFPDDAARNVLAKQPLYSVRFQAVDVWGAGAAGEIYADLFEPYLEHDR